MRHRSGTAGERTTRCRWPTTKAGAPACVSPSPLAVYAVVALGFKARWLVRNQFLTFWSGSANGCCVTTPRTQRGGGFLLVLAAGAIGVVAQNSVAAAAHSLRQAGWRQLGRAPPTRKSGSRPSPRRGRPRDASGRGIRDRATDLPVVRRCFPSDRSSVGRSDRTHLPHAALDRDDAVLGPCQQHIGNRRQPLSPHSGAPGGRGACSPRRGIAGRPAAPVDHGFSRKPLPVTLLDQSACLAAGGGNRHDRTRKRPMAGGTDDE